MKRSAWLLFVPLVLAGCQSSTRTIDLQSGLFSVEQPVPVSGFIPTLFSSDGARMGGFVTDGDAFYFEVRDRDSLDPVARFHVDESTYLPVLFTSDGGALSPKARSRTGIVARIESPSASSPLDGVRLLRLYRPCRRAA